MKMTLLDIAAERMPLIATTILVSLLGLLVQRYFAQPRLSGIPLVGASLGNVEKRRKAFLAGARPIYMEGYQQVCLVFSGTRHVTDTA